MNFGFAVGRLSARFQRLKNGAKASSQPSLPFRFKNFSILPINHLSAHVQERVEQQDFRLLWPLPGRTGRIQARTRSHGTGKRKKGTIHARRFRGNRRLPSPGSPSLSGPRAGCARTERLWRSRVPDRIGRPSHGDLSPAEDGNAAGARPRPLREPCQVRSGAVPSLASGAAAHSVCHLLPAGCLARHGTPCLHFPSANAQAERTRAIPPLTSQPDWTPGRRAGRRAGPGLWVSLKEDSLGG
jgi:hypothetical protein